MTPSFSPCMAGMQAWDISSGRSHQPQSPSASTASSSSAYASPWVMRLSHGAYAVRDGVVRDEPPPEAHTPVHRARPTVPEITQVRGPCRRLPCGALRCSLCVGVWCGAWAIAYAAHGRQDV